MMMRNIWRLLNGTYAPDPIWDKVLNHALDEHTPKRLSPHQAMVGPFRVWVSNYPYSYGARQAGICSDITGLPSKRTRKRLRDAMSQMAISDLEATHDQT